MSRAKKSPTAPQSKMARRCGWKKGRVRRAWLDLPPGTQYSGPSCTKLAGKAVPPGRGGKVGSRTIIGCATPVKPKKNAVRRGRDYVCQGAFVLRDMENPGGRDSYIPKSVARERIRATTRPGLCDHQATGFRKVSPADLRYVERDADAAGVHPWEFVGDLEFPHRKGSSICCPYHPDHAKADPEACWRALVSRVNAKARSARQSFARDTAQRRQRALTRGDDVGDASYQETLRGHEKAMAKKYGVGARHRAA